MFEAERGQIEARNAEARATAERNGAKLEGESYVLIRQAGEGGQLYGSVSGRDVAEVILETGARVERSQVVLDRPIKTVGVQIKLRLHPEVTVTVRINIARSPDEAERQARGENVITSAFDQDRLDAEAQAKDLFEAGAGQAMADASFEH